MTFARIFILALLLMNFTGCEDSTTPGFAVENASLIDNFLDHYQHNGRTQLKVKSSALTRDFFFYGSFIPSLKSSSGHTLKGRVVNFKIVGDQLIMLESARGHALKDFETSSIMLAEFPILETTTDGIIIDFAKGMTNAFTARNVGVQGLGNSSANTSDQFRSVSLVSSYIKSIENKNDVMTISQIAQWRNEKTELLSAEFRYYFREYLPSTTFVKTQSSTNRHVQYFTTPAQVQPETTEAMSHLVKWNIEEPITFYISHNTPERFIGPITDGILFWNHIFNKELFKVKRADAEISAPHPYLNIVQWVTWENEASAYADMVVDHLTGQVMQAQIFFRSGWIVKTRKKLRNHLASLMEENADTVITSLEEDAPMPDMFDFGHACHHDLTDVANASELWHAISTADISEEGLQQLTEDIVRGVMAHETGHVLGLRHNLAGNLGGDLTYQEHADMVRDYLQTGSSAQLGERRVTASVMDVLSVADDALTGSQIRTYINQPLKDSPLKNIYDFDAQAISWGYFGRPMTGMRPFCTDEDSKVYIDCARWDESMQPALSALKKLDHSFTELAVSLAELIIEHISPDRPGGPLSLKDIPVGQRNVNIILQKNIAGAFSWFHESVRSIQAEQRISAFGPHSEEEIRAERFRIVKSEIELSGSAALLFSLVPPFIKTNNSSEYIAHYFLTHLKTRIEQKRAKFPALNFTATDEDEALKLAQKLFKKLYNDYFLQLAKSITRVQFDDPNFQDDFEVALGQIASEIILTTNESKNGEGLPTYKYPQPMREAATHFLSPTIGIKPDWSFDGVAKIETNLRQTINKFGGNISGEKLDIYTLPRHLRAFVVEQKRILNALAQVKNLRRETANK
jgi:hypothetical protein